MQNDKLFEDMALEAMNELGLPEDEAQNMLDEFINE